MKLVCTLRAVLLSAPKLKIRRLASIAFVLAAIVSSHACKGESESDTPTVTRSATATRSAWSGSAVFESRTADHQRTDTYTFRDASWDGTSHLVPAQWRACLDGGCVEANAQCSFNGDVEDIEEANYQLNCHAPGGEYDGMNPPCATAGPLSLCAEEYVISSADPRCERDDPELDENVFCARRVPIDALKVNGGYERTIARSSLNATWQLRRQ